MGDDDPEAVLVVASSSDCEKTVYEAVGGLVVGVSKVITAAALSNGLFVPTSVAVGGPGGSGIKKSF